MHGKRLPFDDLKKVMIIEGVVKRLLKAEVISPMLINGNGVCMAHHSCRSPSPRYDLNA